MDLPFTCTQGTHCCSQSQSLSLSLFLNLYNIILVNYTHTCYTFTTLVIFGAKSFHTIDYLIINCLCLEQTAYIIISVGILSLYKTDE